MLIINKRNHIFRNYFEFFRIKKFFCVLKMQVNVQGFVVNIIECKNLINFHTILVNITFKIFQSQLYLIFQIFLEDISGWLLALIKNNWKLKKKITKHILIKKQVYKNNNLFNVYTKCILHTLRNVKYFQKNGK